MLTAFQKIIFRLLLGLYVIAVFKPFLPYLEYALNKSFIAKQLCENRARPELKCEGQCYLAKRLAQAEEPQTPALPFSHKQSFDPDSFHLRQDNSARFVSAPLLLLSCVTTMRLPTTNFFADIFHPPRSGFASA